jgi:hypothetical protein
VAAQVEGPGRKPLPLEPLTPEAPDAGGVRGAVDQDDRRAAQRVYSDIARRTSARIRTIFAVTVGVNSPTACRISAKSAAAAPRASASATAGYVRAAARRGSGHAAPTHERGGYRRSPNTPWRSSSIKACAPVLNAGPPPGTAAD